MFSTVSVCCITRTPAKTTITTKLLAIGAHINGANEPRAFATCPSIVNSPKKKICGRQYLVKATAIEKSFSKPAVENSGAYKRTNAGAKITPTITNTKRIPEIVVTKREAKPCPPSSSENDLTSCGTKIAVSAPPTSRLYKIFGMVFATLYESANSAVPSTATAKMARKKPVMRERIVPIAMMPEARNRSFVFIAPLSNPTNSLG